MPTGCGNRWKGGIDSEHELLFSLTHFIACATTKDGTAEPHRLADKTDSAHGYS